MLWYAMDFVAFYCYIGVYISPNKTMSILACTMNISKYSTTLISDHLHKRSSLNYNRLCFCLLHDDPLAQPPCKPIQKWLLLADTDIRLEMRPPCVQKHTTFLKLNPTIELHVDPAA